MRISDHVDMLDITSERGAIHPSLIHGESSLILADAALPLQTELLERAVEDAGYTLSDITAVILTHQDLDHIGCVKEIAERSPGLVLMAHEDEAPYIDGRKTPIILAAMEANLGAMPPERKAVYERLKQGFLNRRLKIDRELKTGEALPDCGDIEVLHTPGHKPGHICLYLPRDKALIAGDALNIRGGRLAGPDPGFTPDMDTAMRSLRQLLSYDIRVCVTYHCGALEGGFKEQLEALLCDWGAA